VRRREQHKKYSVVFGGLVLASISATLIQFAISGSREYVDDVGGEKPVAQGILLQDSEDWVRRPDVFP